MHEEGQPVEQSRVTEQQVLRATMPDAIYEDNWYLLKSCSKLLLTYQIKLLTYFAVSKKAKLVLKVKKKCRFSKELRVYVKKYQDTIRVERF